MRESLLPVSLGRMRMLRLVRRLLGAWQADLLVAAGLFALGQVEVWGHATYQGGPVFPGPILVNGLVVVPLLTVPLAVRRRLPLLSFAVVFGTIGWASLAFGGGEATTEFVAALVSLYSVAANGSRRSEALTGAFAVGAVHELRDPHVHGIGDVVWGAGLLLVAWLFGLAVRGRHRRIGELEDETERLSREQDERARAAVAAERTRIARELHDVVAHAVSVVVVQAQAGQRLLGRDEQRTRESLEAIEETARIALVEMRRLLGMLRETDRAQLAPQPSLAEMPALAHQVSDAGLPVELEISGEPVPLAPGVELSAYRLVQEGLTNALKHAAATSATVRVRYGAERLEIEVADNGPGAKGNHSEGGHGLAGLRERVALHGGSLESGPRPAGGWLLHATLPLGDRP